MRFLHEAASGEAELIAAARRHPPAAVTASADSTLRVVCLASGRPLRTLRAHPGRSEALCLDVASDGRLAVTGGSRCKSVRCFDLETGQLVTGSMTDDGPQGEGYCGHQVLLRGARGGFCCVRHTS